MDEAGAVWRKATYSNGQANCVEVGNGASSVLVRDTKEQDLGNDRTVVMVTSPAWSAFLRTLR